MVKKLVGDHGVIAETVAIRVASCACISPQELWAKGGTGFQQN
jgi:hypothetical protein